jgi:FMN-dependent NADH-azoreductase
LLDLSHPTLVVRIGAAGWFSKPGSILLIRQGKTFIYTENGVLGLAKEKKAILVLASGGVFTEGPWKSWDFVEPYLRRILSFIGIDDVQTIRAEGMNILPLAAHAVPNAEKALERLAL